MTLARKHLQWLLPVLILLLALGLARWIKSSAQRPASSPPQEREWQVQVLRLQSQALAPWVPLLGQVISPRETQLTSALTAFVAATPVLAGHEVAAGDLLLRLDPADADLVLAQRQAELSDLKAQLREQQALLPLTRQALERQQSLLELTQKSVQRERSLLERKLSSQSRLEEQLQAEQQQQLGLLQQQQALAQRQALVEQLQARHAKAEALLAQAQLDRTRTEIRAPFAARVISLKVAQGDRVTPGQALLRLYDPAAMEIRAQIPDAQLPQIRQALAQGLALQAWLEEPQGRYRLPLDRLASAVESGQAGVDAFFRLPPDTPVALGRPVSLQLELPAVPDAFGVPAAALFDRSRIFKLVDGRLQPVTVQLHGQYRLEGKTHFIVQAPELADGDASLASALPNATAGLRVRPGAAQ